MNSRDYYEARRENLLRRLAQVNGSSRRGKRQQVGRREEWWATVNGLIVAADQERLVADQERRHHVRMLILAELDQGEACVILALFGLLDGEYTVPELARDLRWTKKEVERVREQGLAKLAHVPEIRELLRG